MAKFKDLLHKAGPEAVVEALLQGEEYLQCFGDFKIPGNGRANCYD
jgi:hypothetical protein